MSALRSRRPLAIALFLAWIIPLAGASDDPGGRGRGPWRVGEWSAQRGLLLRGRVVTMDAGRRVLEHGRVLVRDGVIEAVWDGPAEPEGVTAGDAVEIDLGPRALIFPGLMNLHDHPVYAALPAWLPPSSHLQPASGRPTGVEPYANRYQWNVVSQTSPPEYRRLVDTPSILLTSTAYLNLMAESLKWAEVKGVLGGQTTIQGAPINPATDGWLARNADNLNFGRDRVENRVASIGSLSGAALNGLLTRLRNGAVDAWIVHLGEGVRDWDRRPGDGVSSRAEFAALQQKGLLTDATVIVHGTGLERPDFDAMAHAPSIRLSGAGDGLGAKLVWSPLSNLLLYGQTTDVYEALAAGVLVSLGSDWSVSGSRHVLAELKIADIALRDHSLLGPSRGLLAEFSIEGKHGKARMAAEAALDRMLVEMVTINPARTIHWDDAVGSIEAGKLADLVVVSDPRARRMDGVPDSPYRALIDASEHDVRLVLVGGEPVSGDADIMSALKPGDVELVGGGCRPKAVDVTASGVPGGGQTLASIEAALGDALAALGGDNPPPGGGPADPSNTYSYLKARIPGAAGLSDVQFAGLLAAGAGTVDGRINLERIALSPLLTASDDWFFAIADARVSPATGLIADPTPPYGLYPGNANHLVEGANPLSAAKLERRWYWRPDLCGGPPSDAWRPDRER